MDMAWLDWPWLAALFSNLEVKQEGNCCGLLNMATELADRYELEPYIRQRIRLIKDDIENIFGEGEEGNAKQFSLSRFV